MNDFKDRLVETMKRLNIKAVDLVDATGIDKSSISNYMSGNYLPKQRRLTKIAHALNVDEGWLLTGVRQNRETRPAVKIPILGHVVAGVPIEAVTDILGYEEITQNMADTGDFFALKIQGHSMEPRLEEGDIVVVRKQSYADSGDIAIILVNGNEATCKQIKKSDTGITLIGFNPVVYPPHFYSKEEIASLPVSIIGIVVESRHTWVKI